MTTIDSNIYQDLGLTRQQETKKERDQLGQEEFLKLMTTQLMNQDPMEPMQNGEFLTQIAQFGTVSGIEDLQKSFATLADSLSSNQAMQAGALVGKNVMAPSDLGIYVEGGLLSGVAELPVSSSNVSMKVYDVSGQLVRTVDLGMQEAGDLQFHWDGIKDDGTYAADGFYQVRVDGLVNGQNEQLKTFTAMPVESVSVGKPGEPLMLNLYGVGAVQFNEVKQIL